MSKLRRLMMMFPRPTSGDDPEPTVTVDGYFALLTDFDDTRISNKYITSAGGESAYNGWDISGYVEIPDDAKTVYYGTTASNVNFSDVYTGIYNSSKTYMQHLSNGGELPSGAKYLRLSDTTAKVDGGFVILLKEQED